LLDINFGGVAIVWGMAKWEIGKLEKGGFLPGS
jgi:hypothetical protein